MPRHWSRWLVTSGGPMLSREIGGRRPAGQAVDGKRDEEIGGGRLWVPSHWIAGGLSLSLHWRRGVLRQRMVTDKELLHSFPEVTALNRRIWTLDTN